MKYLLTLKAPGFLLVFIFILLGCVGPRPEAPPPVPTPQIQSSVTLPTAAPPEIQALPTPTATPVVINSTAPASVETVPENGEDTIQAEADVPEATRIADPVSSIDLTRLPLGDGKLSSSPQAGWIWACRTDPNAGGAFQDGPWIRADGTYDFTAKAVVDGAVTWSHQFEMTLQEDRRIFTTNDLPNHATGTYPIAPTDDAYQTDRNPNSIASQNFQVELPANPTLAAQPSCVPGAIGILLTGSVLFNALDAPGRDAVAHETQDSCQGHPQEAGVYHYHNLTTCLADTSTSDGHSTLLGYIVDGFGIYGHHGEGGQELTSADLDECHGHTHKIEWNGQMVEMYHYHATWDFPYTVGCLRGSYEMSDVMAISGAPGGQAGGPTQGNQGAEPAGGPPQGSGNGQPAGPADLAAAAAKLGITEQQLREALGPPPPDFAAAASKLGISEQALRQALGVP